MPVENAGLLPKSGKLQWRQRKFKDGGTKRRREWV